MKRSLVFKSMLFLALTVQITLFNGCSSNQQKAVKANPMKQYAADTKSEYSYEFYKTIEGDGYTTHILRMVSGQWLSTKEVKDPEWWHWVKIVVPDSLASDISLLFISGGDRYPEEPGDADKIIRAAAINTGALAIYLHNVPNQKTNFVGDDYGPRVEDELIAYGWRKFLEAGGGDESLEWLARLPMSRAAVRTMDTVTEYAQKKLNHKTDKFVVAGASKRGWTTWATAIADDRVVAIAPIVIDVLNVVPSFMHHWRAYGAWSPAVDDYVHEHIMEWMGSVEYQKLLDAVDPYSYREQLDLPKMMINASQDEFFLPDSWQFYWDDLVGEKNIRYVPNTGHSLDGTDAANTLVSFFHDIVTKTPRPVMDWKVVDGTIHAQTGPNSKPIAVKLWQVYNPDGRDFRNQMTNVKWTSTDIPIAADGKYVVSVDAPEKGWKGFMVEFEFKGEKVPLKLTSGIVVVPDTYPFSDYKPEKAFGTPLTK